MIKNQESQTPLVNWELTASIAWAWSSDLCDYLHLEIDFKFGNECILTLINN